MISVDSSPVNPVEDSLGEFELRVLEFERRNPQTGGTKADAVRTQLGISAARYYQVLNLVIDSPAALAYDPMLIRRLLRIRESRMKARFAIRTKVSAN